MVDLKHKIGIAHRNGSREHGHGVPAPLKYSGSHPMHAKEKMPTSPFREAVEPTRILSQESYIHSRLCSNPSCPSLVLFVGSSYIVDHHSPSPLQSPRRRRTRTHLLQAQMPPIAIVSMPLLGAKLPSILRFASCFSSAVGFAFCISGRYGSWCGEWPMDMPTRI